MCCSLCILCSFRTAPTTTTMWGACGQKRAGPRRACRADVQQRYRADGAGRRGQPPFLNVSDAGVPVGLAAYEERWHTCRRAECWACCRLFLQDGVPHHPVFFPIAITCFFLVANMILLYVTMGDLSQYSYHYLTCPLPYLIQHAIPKPTQIHPPPPPSLRGVPSSVKV